MADIRMHIFYKFNSVILSARAGCRSHCLLYLLCFTVRCWPVPQQLRRSVGRHMLIVPLGKLQPHIRQGQAVACIAIFGLPNVVMLVTSS